MTMTREEFLNLVQEAVEIVDGGQTDEEDKKNENDELWDDNGKLHGGFYAASERAAREVGLPVTEEKGDLVVLAIYWRQEDALFGEEGPSLKLPDLIRHIDAAWEHMQKL